MTVLNSLILKMLSSETQQATQTEQQDEADLFLDTNHVPAQNIQQVDLIFIRGCFTNIIMGE